MGNNEEFDFDGSPKALNRLQVRALPMEVDV